MQSDSISGLILYEPWMVVEDQSLFTPAQLERFDMSLPTTIWKVS